jgi:hypothetical protein
VWRFLFPSSLITSTTSTVIVQNVGDGAHVGLYWDVGSQATLNGPTFEGNVLAGTLIAVGKGVTIDCSRLASSTACRRIALGRNCEVPKPSASCGASNPLQRA